MLSFLQQDTTEAVVCEVWRAWRDLMIVCKLRDGPRPQYDPYNARPEQLLAHMYEGRASVPDQLAQLELAAMQSSLKVLVRLGYLREGTPSWVFEITDHGAFRLRNHVTAEASARRLILDLQPHVSQSVPRTGYVTFDAAHYISQLNRLRIYSKRNWNTA